MNESRARVLVVEDARNWRDYLQATLQGLGCQVAAAAGFEAGRALLDDGPYHLAVVDVRLYEGEPADESGLRLVQEAWGRGAAAGFVVLSGYSTAAHVAAVLGPKIPYRMVDKADITGAPFRETLRALLAAGGAHAAG